MVSGEAHLQPGQQSRNDSSPVQGNPTSPAAADVSHSADGAPLSAWERRKRELMAQLDGPETPSQSASSPPESNGTAPSAPAPDKNAAVVRRLQEALQQRDREIARLRQQLQQYESRNEVAEPEPSPDAAAPAPTDEAIAEERRRLEELQKEWEDKLGRAEVELSVERARLAREKVRLEEFQQALEAQERRLGSGGQDDPEQQVEAGPADPKRPSGGRWLRRLGLRKS